MGAGVVGKHFRSLHEFNVALTKRSCHALWVHCFEHPYVFDGKRDTAHVKTNACGGEGIGNTDAANEIGFSVNLLPKNLTST